MKKAVISSIIILTICCLLGCTKKEEKTEELKKNIPLPINKIGKVEEDFKLKTNYTYKLIESHEVDGRQGIAYDNNKYYISGSTSLSIYNNNWKIITSTDKPFENFKNEVNHLGDIDVYNNEVYAGVEYFMDGKAKNIQIAIYDATNLK